MDGPAKLGRTGLILIGVSIITSSAAVTMGWVALSRAQAPRATFPLARTDIRAMARSFAPVAVRQAAEAWRDGSQALRRGESAKEAVRIRNEALDVRLADTLELWAYSRFRTVCKQPLEPQTKAEREAMIRDWDRMADGLESWAVDPEPIRNNSEPIRKQQP